MTNFKMVKNNEVIGYAEGTLSDIKWDEFGSKFTAKLEGIPVMHMNDGSVDYATVEITNLEWDEFGSKFTSEVIGRPEPFAYANM